MVGRDLKKRIREHYDFKNIRSKQTELKLKTVDETWDKLYQSYKLETQPKFFVNVRVSADITYIYKDKKYTKRETFREVYETRDKKEIKKIGNKWWEQKKKLILSNSPVDKIKNVKKEWEVIKQQAGTDLKKIKMKDCSAYMLDTQGDHSWDTKTGKCVYDFLIHRYSQVKGIKKLAKNYETLTEIFTENDFDCVEQSDPLETGVDFHQIKNFCVKAGLSLYCLDLDTKMIDYYHPPKPNKNAGATPVLYRIGNNHFYPVLDLNSKQLMNWVREEVHSNSKEKYQIEKNYDIKVIETGDTFQTLCDIIKETNKMPFPMKKNIRFDGNDIVSFVIEDINTKYVLTKKETDTEQQDLIKEYCEHNSTEYTGQVLGDILMSIMKETYPKMPKSHPNPEVFNSLKQSGVKHRTHYGLTGVELNETAFACDLNKCYTSCMIDPLDDFILLDFNSSWESFNFKETLPLGLYYVETNDFKLLHGTNIYSNKILDLALKEKLIRPADIKQQLITTPKEKKDFLKKVIDAITSKTVEGKLRKLLWNSVSGLIGKTKSTRYKVHLNTDKKQVFKDLVEEGNKFLLQTENICVYGDKYETSFAEHNVPIYIQILDWSNIKLYQMSQEMGGEIAFRKTDLAVCVNSEKKPAVSDTIGGFKFAELPSNMKTFQDTDRTVKAPSSKEWTLCDISDSDEWEKIHTTLLENEGLLLLGRAGTGKTYTAKKIAEQFERAEKIAFTNKAALVINGKTIHRFMLDGDLNIKSAKLAYCKTYKPLIVVDEISMNSGNLWKKLCELKRLTGCPFLLVGDERQCAPPEDNSDIDDYFNHSAVKYLANNLKCELTARKRYDKELWDILEDVEGIDLSRFTYRSTAKNICYLNTTRKRINAKWNKRLKPKGFVFLEADITDKYQQDTIVYQDLPVICRMTIHKGETACNNEQFVVKEFDETQITVENERTSFSVKSEKFLETFAMGYCITTHKAQGDTITEDFTIYDWNLMDKKLKYTALSRAKNADQVYIVHNKDYTFPKYTRIKEKVKGYYTQDEAKNRLCDLTEKFVSKLLKNPRCFHCDMICEDTGERQYTIDRIDDDLGHLESNCVLSCLRCNIAKSNKNELTI
jgi:hypothetical protein